MRKHLVLLVILTVALTCCNNHQKKSASADSEFQRISEEYMNGYLAWRPLYALSLGIHEYDGKLADFSKASIDAEVARLKKYDRLVSEIDTASLSPEAFYDLRVLKSAIRYEIFNSIEMEPFTTNPMVYPEAFDVSFFIKREFAPLENRLQSIIATEKQAPALFASAKLNLKDSLAKPYIELAIQNTKGIADFLKNDVTTAVSEVNNDSLLNEFKIVNDQAIKELNTYAEYLEKEKMPKSHTHYAIGADKMYKMLQSNGINIRPEKILEMGRTALEKEKAAFNATAKIIDPNKKPVEVLLALQKEHPMAENLIPDSRKFAESIHQFVMDKKIITLPSETRAIVKETPKYLRSFGMASLHPAGPLEKQATQSYYFITPVEPTWNDQQKEEWLAMFDNYTTQVITIHEVYPGHYVQSMHLNASDANKLEKIFMCFSFDEGWAHYAEQMMIEEGFGNTGDSVTAAKYHLAQLNESIKRLCRVCVAIETHCNGMQLDQATRFFMDNWQQGEKPSHGEAMRGTYDPGYLFYSLGKWELLKLREDYKKQEGPNFSLQKFHDQVLDHGSPPIILLRERLLKDKNSWTQIL